MKTGIKPGLTTNATIRKYNNDGTVTISLNDISLSLPNSDLKVPLPVAWTSPSGGLLAGFPAPGTTVRVQQGHAGEWTILGFVASNQIFSDFSLNINPILYNSKNSDFQPDRIVGRVNDGTRFYLDPKIGFNVGQETQNLHLNPNQKILTISIDSNYQFNNSSRSISGNVKRDLGESAIKNSLNSLLDSHSYENSLTEIGLDPSATVSALNNSNIVRNPPLIESREIVYEFSADYFFDTYLNELSQYQDPTLLNKPLRNSRRNNRTDTISLSLEYPNYLIESVKGTVVDTFGNILDLNRNSLPIGKIQSLSLKDNPKKDEAFVNILQELRKSLAFHFEINARKDLGENLSTPDVDTTDDYSRKRSKFFLDIDKEGQTLINIPASSETGNIALPVRHENYSVLLNKKDGSVNSNEFVKAENYQDVYLDSFAGKASIKLSGEGDLDGYASPEDRIKEESIKFGTVFHDITKVCNEFQESALYLQAGLKLVNWDQDHRLNTLFTPYEYIITDNIIVSGPEANAGGRSLTVNLDGMANFSIGANTIDRQSLWLDLAGGAVTAFGRDKQNISWASSFDGDVLLEIGGVGIGNEYDSRFSDLNDAYRNGTIEIRVHNNGIVNIFRMSSNGVDITSNGTITCSSQQDIIFRSNGNFLVEAENIMLYAETSKRIVNRFPNTTIG